MRERLDSAREAHGRRELSPAGSPVGSAEIHVLKVGQGDPILVKLGITPLPAPHATVATNLDRMILSSWVSNVAPWTRAVATRIRSAGSR